VPRQLQVELNVRVEPSKPLESEIRGHAIQCSRLARGTQKRLSEQHLNQPQLEQQLCVKHRRAGGHRSYQTGTLCHCPQ